MRIMNRYAVVVVSAAVPMLLAGFASAQDSVDYRDLTTGAIQNTKGSILEEGVGGITVRAGGGAATYKLVPSQIVQVIYADLPKGLNLDYPVATTAEKDREYEKALQQYEKVLPMVPPGTNSRRQAEFRIAMLKATLIGDGEDSVPLPTAIASLKDFINAYPGSWQFTAASQNLARLQLSDSRFDDALSTLQKLGEAPGIPEETKVEVDLMTVDALLRAEGRKAEAKQKIDALLASLPNSSPKRQNLEIYSLLADETVPLPKAVETLNAVIAKSAEQPEIRGLAYNTLGDFYTRNGKKRDAMWSHLWVDVVYSQDIQQHMYAVTRLSKIFEDLGETERSKLYKEKLKTLR